MHYLANTEPLAPELRITVPAAVSPVIATQEGSIAQKRNLKAEGKLRKYNERLLDCIGSLKHRIYRLNFYQCYAEDPLKFVRSFMFQHSGVLRMLKEDERVHYRESAEDWDSGAFYIEKQETVEREVAKYVAATEEVKRGTQEVRRGRRGRPPRIPRPEDAVPLSQPQTQTPRPEGRRRGRRRRRVDSEQENGESPNPSGSQNSEERSDRKSSSDKPADESKHDDPASNNGSKRSASEAKAEEEEKGEKKEQPAEEQPIQIQQAPGEEQKHEEEEGKNEAAK